jgi:hypothetical protein
MTGERTDLEWKVKLAVTDLLAGADGAAIRLQLDHGTLGKINIVIGDDEFLRSQASGDPLDLPVSPSEQRTGPN